MSLYRPTVPFFARSGKSPGSRVAAFVLNLVCPGGHVSCAFRLPGLAGLAHQHTEDVALIESIGSITLRAITNAPG